MHDFLQLIYTWYVKNQRELPWRETRDPYKIWVSEIILQQTRVSQGISYYQNFIETFPDIFQLAYAGEDEVLKLWQGLGYYTRARNMHATAKLICSEYNGRFPDNYSGILALKGIGPYTAAIIASIAFNLPFPALDGNIFRLLARYFGIRESPAAQKGKNVFYQVAREIMPGENPGFHNQAMMEFGALQCVPKSPACSSCPLVRSCYAYNHHCVEKFPVRIPKPKSKSRYFYYYYIESGNNTWLEKRTGNDIWKNLYQFPLLESETELTDTEVAALKPGFLGDCPVNIKFISPVHKHVLSHQVIYARLIQMEASAGFQPDSRFIRVEERNLLSFAVPRLIEKLTRGTKIFENL